MTVKTKKLLQWMATATSASVPVTLFLGASKAAIRRLRLALDLGAILGATTVVFAIDSTLQSQAKISKSAAEKIALSKVPAGIIQSAELEREHGMLIWSFDISKASSKDVTEVQIDARSGRIVSVRIETPAAQVKERKSES